LIGVAQGIATMPGISRSGSTVAACLLCGFDKKFAVKYSFIMSIPAILGSLLLELVKTDLSGVTSGVLVNYIVGTVVAAVVGYIFIKVMLAAVKKKKFTGFSIYCFVAGVTAIVLHFIKL
ncbi:MAG: undecaprenyl-diphosphate phosphatase, partial [Lachnospiraceae bacterium]|nr:undecaprenyl-diphosphate phosphatase [Lachnospiraceae bacterium]